MTVAPSIVAADERRDASSSWVLPAHVGVLGFTAFLYVYNLTVSGYANTFYSMAAQAAAQSWSSWFWGSLDPSNFITVDKPPLSTMLMGLSVRVFGLSPWTILLPEAICGVAAIAVLYAIVRRTAGPVAATVAALVAALTPVAVLIFRFNNPDALLTLLLLLAAWAFMRALQDGRFRWLILSGLLVGLAFNTKFLQAYLVLPAFAIVFLIAAPVTLRRRVAGLLVAAASVLVFSLWWVAAVQLTPADMRPYVGGSTDGTALQLLFGYDGLGRIFGQLSGGIAPTARISNFPGPGSSASFSGEPGLLRLFNNVLAGQVAWLLPFAGIGAASSLILRWRRPRTDLPRAAVLMWTIWLATHALVFSFMTGIIHSYYTVVMAPAIGALVGTGMVDLWRARATHRRVAASALAAAIATTAALGWELLNRTPDFLPGIAEVVLVVGLCAAAAVALLAFADDDRNGAMARTIQRATVAAAALGMVALLTGPAAYAVQTMATSYNGGDPAAGPAYARASFTGLAGLLSPTGTTTGGARGQRPQADGGFAPSVGTGVPVPAGNFVSREPGGMNQADLEYLFANRGSARWLVAASGSNEAAPIQLATGQPVMAMGGFNGSDPYPTLEQLQQFIHSGEIRFVLAANQSFGSFGLGQGQAVGISGWVRNNCHPAIIDGGSATDLYDCAGAA
ncbi:MAG TPA: glycosyltransferase family 39 protein [Candidatus Limnocylindrales bacterium]